MHLKGAETEFIIARLKKNDLRKGRSGAQNRDVCLKFSQAEGNVKAFLVKSFWKLSSGHAEMKHSFKKMHGILVRTADVGSI